MEKALKNARKTFQKIKTKAELYELMCDVSGSSFDDIVSLSSQIEESEFLEIFLTCIRYGYKHNNDYINFLILYKKDKEFKLALAEKCISYETLNRHYMHFIGDLFYENYLSFDDFKLIFNLYLEKAKAHLIVLVAYCKNKIQECDANCWNEISKIAFENADESFNDFSYVLQEIGDDGKITDDNAEFFTVMVGKKMFIDVFYDRLDEITGKEKMFFKLFNKPRCFNYSPFSFAILNGSIKCVRHMILNIREENLKKTAKFAKLSIKGGNIETVRVLQEFALKRSFTINEILYALKCKKYDIVRWILTTCDTLELEMILAINDPIDLYFVSKFFDLAPYLLCKTNDYESTVVICETSQILPKIQNVSDTDFKTFAYLLAKHLLDVPKIFPSTISNYIRLKLILSTHRDEIKLKQEHLQSAIVSGHVDSLTLLMENGLRITDVDPETILCCAMSSGSANMVKYVMDYVNFSYVNFNNLTRAFRDNGLNVASLVFSKCNDISCLRHLYQTFLYHRISRVFYNRLQELGVDPDESEESIDYSEILSDIEAFS